MNAILKTGDVRIINELNNCRVYFHTNDRRTICRTMQPREIAQARTIRRQYGDAAFRGYLVALFNLKYSEPQARRRTPATAAAERFGLLHGMRRMCPLPADEEAEYKKLLSGEIF